MKSCLILTCFVSFECLSAPQTQPTTFSAGQTTVQLQKLLDRKKSAALTELRGDDRDVVPGVLLPVQLPKDVHGPVACVDVEHSVHVGAPINGVPAQEHTEESVFPERGILGTGTTDSRCAESRVQQAGRTQPSPTHFIWTLSLIPFFPFLNTVFKAKHAQNQSKLLFALRNEKGFVMKTKLLFTSTRHKLHHLIKCFLKPSDFCYKLNLDKPQKNMFYKLPSVISNRAFTFEFMFQKVWTHPPLKRLQELMHVSGTAKSQRRPYSCMCRDGTPPPPLSAWLAGLLQASSITLALPSNWKSCFSNDSRSEQHILRPAPMLRHFLSHRIQTAWAPIC